MEDQCLSVICEKLRVQYIIIHCPARWKFLSLSSCIVLGLQKTVKFCRYYIYLLRAEISYESLLNFSVYIGIV